MGDTRKHKYKGKVCSPPAATTAEHKQTKQWCKGKVGREHVPVVLYDARPSANWGLAVEAWERCAVCEKHLRSSWEIPQPTHRFADIVRAIERAKGIALHDDLIFPKIVDPALKYMADIADALGVRIVIEFHEKGKRRSWGRHVRVSTGQEPEID